MNIRFRWPLPLRGSLVAWLLAVACGIPMASRHALAVEPAVLMEQARRVQVVESFTPSVVAIFSHDANGGGSGVIISPDGYTVTNFHVVEGLGPFMKCGLPDGKIYDAVLVGIDPTGDVALIQLLGRDDFPAAQIGDSDTVQVGDWAYAAGNPFLLASNLQPSVSYGVVSGVHRYQYPAGTILEYTDCIQVDASINPGNSGGPLFNDLGELVGINGRASFEKRGRVNSGAGYAISINQVMNFLDHLKSGRIVDHATLGATVTGGDDGAVYVRQILQQSEAYRRGLRTGDEVVSFAGRPIRSVNQFKNILGIYPQGWTVPLVYRRDDSKQEILVRLRPLHRQAELRLSSKPPDGPRRPDEDAPEGERPDPESPHPEPAAPGAKKLPPPPPEYAHLYRAKVGYTNWYFNEQNRTRILAGIRELGDFTKVRGNWELQGQQGAVPFTFKLNDKAVAADLGGTPAVQLADQTFADVPAGTGGLLAALYQFRRLLTDPDEYFTEFYYLGSEPFTGGEPGRPSEQVDVLITSRGTVTTRWYFSRQDGKLLGWDTAVEEDADECQIRISAVQEFGTHRFPSKFTVSHAGSSLGTFAVEKATLSAAE